MTSAPYDASVSEAAVDVALAPARLAALNRRWHASMPHRRGRLMRHLLTAADVLGLSAAFLLVEFIAPAPSDGRWALRSEVLLFVATLPMWILLAEIQGLYKRDEERADYSTADDLVGVLQLVTMGSWLFLVTSGVTGLASPSVGKLAVFWVLAVALVTSSRAAGRALGRRSTTYLQNALIVGAGYVGQSVAKKLLKHGEYGITLVGFVDDAPRAQSGARELPPLLGGTDALEATVRRYAIDRVIVAFSNDGADRTLDLVRRLRELDVQIDVVPRLFEVIPAGVHVHAVEGLPLVGLPPSRLPRPARIVKRAVDLLVATTGIVLLLPCVVPIALAIKVDSPGPVFFRQRRIGRRGEVFEIFKFRTMCADAEARKPGLSHLNRHAGGDDRMFKIDGDPRVTRVGKLLRRYSLDELPQLVNVVRGEMSIVGPRPLVAEEADHVRDWARKRLDLTPGITGLWQVLGRSAIPFEEMVRLDYTYVTTWSVWHDVKLMLKTIPIVARGASD